MWRSVMGDGKGAVDMITYQVRRGRILAALLAAPYIAASPCLAQTATTPIQHVIFIMQENRSFDNYFGTYPGADGIPAGTCIPLNPANPSLGCVAPYHDQTDAQGGSNHDNVAAMADIDNGLTSFKMDGFVAEQILKIASICAKDPNNAICTGGSTGITRHDVMGYHTATEVSSYWAYAQHFVLQDRFFSSQRGFSLPAHYYLSSEWSATCTNQTVTLSCNSDANPSSPTKKTVLPWSSLFQFLDVNHVSWKWYLGEGQEPDCADDTDDCPPQIQTATIGSVWNPAPIYAWVKSQGSAYLAAHNPTTNQLLGDLASGQLAQVSWVVPSVQYSEHPTDPITPGMEYVTSIVNAVMQSPYWANTAIFISWDDWGGFYDHVVPPNVDYPPGNATVLGYGLRVPGLMISAYARRGLIDHQLLSFDNYARLVEDLFIGGTRLNPAALGNPDNRPDERDGLTRVTFPDGHKETVGTLLKEFNFTQKPLPPLVLNAHIPVGLAISCRQSVNDHTATCTKPIVKITWDTLTGPQIPQSFVYHVLRDGAELPQCAGTALLCTDTPPAGTHFYRIYSVDPNGVASPISAAAQADAL
jgi:phospholipase C